MTASVLIVDDEPFLPNDLLRFLEGAGYVVCHAGAGISGFDAVRRHRPDVIVLDLHRSDIDGFEVRRALADELGLVQTPVIYLTEDALVAASELPYDPGANLFVKKPFERGDLLSVIDRALAGVARSASS